MRSRTVPRLQAYIAAIIFLALSAGLSLASDGAAAEDGATDWKAFLAPFHSVFLHLPIGFVTIALVLELYAFFQKGNSLRRAIGLVLWISAISAILASWLGVLRSDGGGYEENALRFHRSLGLAVAGVTLVLAVIHVFAFPATAKPRSALAYSYRFLLFANVGLLSLAGHYGGNLTHGSKYLFENAPEWVQSWAEQTEATLTAPFVDDAGDEPGAPSPAEIGAGHFADTIRPILEEKCFQCHGEEKQKADYRMDTIEGLFTAGESEIDPIVPGRALDSYLIEVVTLPPDDDYVMPPEGKEPLSGEEILLLTRWIWNGAETGVEEAAKAEAGGD